MRPVRMSISGGSGARHSLTFGVRGDHGGTYV